MREREKLFSHAFPDKLHQLIQSLQQAKEQAYDKPTALYVHCAAGVDRTGEVIACYQMLVNGKSYKAALAEAEDFAQTTSGDPFSKYNAWAIKLYAYFLKEHEDIKTIGDID